tara:strand:- start:217 stop:399 length:183 start_codon:yes stop_codon:yes gene_type:complete
MTRNNIYSLLGEIDDTLDEWQWHFDFDEKYTTLTSTTQNKLSRDFNENEELGKDPINDGY